MKKNTLSEKYKINQDLHQFLINSRNYLSGDILTKIIAIISIPIFTYLLKPYEYGLISIFISIYSILSIIFGLGISGSLVRSYFEKDHNIKLFIGSNILLILSITLFFLPLLYFYRDNISKILNLPENLILPIILITFFSVFYQFYQNYLIAIKNSRKFSILNIIKDSTVFFIAVILILKMNNQKYLGKIYSEIIVNFIIFIYISYSIIKISKFKIHLPYLKYSLCFGLPIVFHSLSAYILKHFDIIIINQLVGEEQTGLYSFAYKIAMFLYFIIMAINKSWTPIFYEQKINGKFNSINSLIKNYIKIITFFTVCFILFSKEIVLIISPKEYHQSLNIIPIIIIAYYFLFMYTVYVQYSFFRKKTYLIAISTLIAGGINILLNYWLIPLFNYKVAAFTTLFSYFILFILHFLNVKYLLKEKEIIKLSYFVKQAPFILFFFILFYITLYLDNKYILIIIIKIIFWGIYLFIILKSINIKKLIKGNLI